MDNPIVPFGKYKGERIQYIFQKDAKYLGWLLEQDWFQDKFPELLEAIENLFDVEYGW